MEDLLFLVKIAIDGVILPVFISQNIMSFVTDCVKLNRLTHYEGCLIKKDNVLFIKDELSKVKEEVFLDIEKILDSRDEETKKIVLSNLENVIIEKKFTLNDHYDPKSNKIKYFFEKGKYPLLLNASSSCYLEEQNIILSGFKQQYDWIVIGDALNKGYTELLATRIFRNDFRISLDDPLIKMAKQIEETFTDPKDMEALYFRHDLPGLISHLENFMDRSKAIYLLLDIDLYKFDKNILNPMCIYDKKTINDRLSKIKSKKMDI